jgi:hypothetical protein
MKQEWFKGLEEYLEDPAASDWFKLVLNSALQRDPVDALNDAEVLVTILRSELDKHLKKPPVIIQPKFIGFLPWLKTLVAYQQYSKEYSRCDRLPPLDDEAP